MNLLNEKNPPFPHQFHFYYYVVVFNNLYDIFGIFLKFHMKLDKDLNSATAKHRFLIYLNKKIRQWKFYNTFVGKYWI